MKKTEVHPQQSNFWFGFALGATAGLSALFMLGTEKGRDRLKKLIKVSENLEEHLADIMDDVKEKGHEIEERVVEPALQKAESSGIQSVIDKIKSFSESNKDVKKFFVKE